jgi:hypothetical protein
MRELYRPVSTGTRAVRGHATMSAILMPSVAEAIEP